jgi:large subunit ribosomal protein L9e
VLEFLSVVVVVKCTELVLIFVLLYVCRFTVKVELQGRTIQVTGPLGTLKRSFKYLAMDLSMAEDARSLKVDVWFGNRENVASIRTVTSHIENMITGVTKGFKYKMRFCYAHFPINVTSVKEGSDEIVEIRNFLGEQKARRVTLLDGVSFVRTADVKDQIELTGIDINKVSLSAAHIQQSTNVRKKDIRKFLDGIYVSETGAMVEEE